MVALAVFNHRVGWPLQVRKVLDGRLVERRQRQNDVGREVPRGHRKVRTAEVGRRTKRRQQVVHQREVHHFFQRDRPNLAAPAIDGCQFLFTDALVYRALHCAHGVDVAEHDGVFEGCPLGEQKQQFLAVTDDIDIEVVEFPQVHERTPASNCRIIARAKLTDSELF